MSVLIRENLQASTVHEPVTKQARLTVPRGILPLLPDGDFRPYNGVAINDLSSLYPLDELRRRCVDGAKQWVSRKAKDGDDLLTAEADVKVYGPYRSRAGTYATSKNDMQTVGFGEDEDFNDDLADFVLEAVFIQTRYQPLQTKAEA